MAFLPAFGEAVTIIASSNPITASLLIAGVTGVTVFGIIMGSGSAKELNFVKSENKEVKEALARLQKDYESLVKTVESEGKEYDKIHNYILNGKFRIRSGDKYALIGPKGSGKSTFIWMHNLCEKPIESLKDGTTQVTSNDDVIDTIGIDITLEHLLRLIVLFIIKGIPNTLYLFYNSDRLIEPKLLLQMLGIPKCYLVSLNIDYIYEKYTEEKEFNIEDNDKKLYRNRIYEALKDDNFFIPVKHGKPPALMNCLGDIIKKLFPTGYVDMPEMKRNDDDILNTYRRRICQLIYEFEVKYDKNEQEFINAANRK